MYMQTYSSINSKYNLFYNSNRIIIKEKSNVKLQFSRTNNKYNIFNQYCESYNCVFIYCYFLLISIDDILLLNDIADSNIPNMHVTLDTSQEKRILNDDVESIMPCQIIIIYSSISVNFRFEYIVSQRLMES